MNNEIVPEEMTIKHVNDIKTEESINIYNISYI